MGLIRKTASVGTLGIVSFRSKKEKLRRAERAQRDAERLLDQERTARSTAEQRIADAEKRVKKARDAAAAATRQLERTKRRSGGGRKTKATRAKEAAASVRAVVEPHVESVTARATDAVEHLTSN